MKKMEQNRGVYFVANDRVLELALGFLQSFRHHNPDIPLCLIPFRKDTERLLQYQEKFHFQVFNNETILHRCDAISQQFHPSIVGHYRKLACWAGPFEAFLYIDIDTLILKNLDFVFSLLEQWDFILSFSDRPELEQWVWKPGIRAQEVLTEAQIAFAANTGFICSRKEAFSWDDIMQKAEKASRLREWMVLDCMDQPLINYLIVNSGKPYTSLYKRLDQSDYPEGYIEFWAGNPAREMLPGRKARLDGKVRDIFMIHWAGTWQLRKWEIRLFILLNLFKLRKRIWTLSVRMPFRKLWKHYRYLP
jgi:hypothetical protein